MGVKPPQNHPHVPQAVNITANSTNYDVTVISPLSSGTTLERGPLLGIMRPVWIKTTESEERIRWLIQMIGKRLLVRDIEAFLHSTCEKLRSEESKLGEEEREVLMRLMILKRNDERRNLRKLKREKETLRRQVQKEFGKKRCYNIIVKSLRKEVRERRTELRKKYNKKLEHLAEVRKREINEKKKEHIPKEMQFYENCRIFTEEKREISEKGEQDAISIGKIDLDEDERAILRLNPKFAVTRYLEEEEQERDIELGLAKLRYEIRRLNDKKELEEYDMGEERKRKIRKVKDKTYTADTSNYKDRDKEELEEARTRMIFEPTTKQFNYAKRRTTDLKENSKITLPKSGTPKEEAELEMIRKIILDEFNKYKKELDNTNRRGRVSENRERNAKERENKTNKIDKDTDKEKREDEGKEREDRNQEWSNLTQSERRGLKKIRKRIKDDQIVVLKTDKSGKLAIMAKEEYLKIGLSKIEKDRKLTRTEIKKNEEKINSHTRMILKIVNAGEMHGHHKRIRDSKITHSETSAPMYFMYKDHKKEGGWRPVVSGCNSNTLGLSNLLSDMVESVCGSVRDPYEVISSEDMLSRIESFNDHVKEEKN